MDQLFLIGKRCDHTDTFIGIIFDKLYDLFRFPWCGIFVIRGIPCNIFKYQRCICLTLTVDHQFVVIIFLIVKCNDLFITAVMVAE